MYKRSGIISVIILYFHILLHADARMILSSDLNSTDDSGEDLFNNVDSNESSKEDVCVLSEMPPTPDSNCCGIDVTTNDRIVGGSPTLIKQYPWLALIIYEDQSSKELLYGCGGSLISGLYVLTAGHCVAGEIRKYLTPFSVNLGDYDKFHEGPDCVMEKNGEASCTDGEVNIGIENITPYEFFNPVTQQNDIALIKLIKMAPYTDFIRPICLPASDRIMTYHENLWLTVAGWGVWKQQKVADNSAKGYKYVGETSRLKQALDVPFIPLEKCNEMTNWGVRENQICAGGVKNKNACKGDSGSPLMYNNDGQFELVGVVSSGFSSPCGEENIPEVYTHVFRYHDWIRNVIKEGTEKHL